MDKEIQRIAWAVLPKEFKEEVKKDYFRLAVKANRTQYERGVTTTYLNLFGRHNLISDAEEENEVLTVPRSKVIELYRNYCAECDNEVEGSANRLSLGGRLAVLMELFGSKCLPAVSNYS